MDASVNMKMTPAEHRLIHSAVEESAARSRDMITNQDLSPSARREAREREARLRDLLAKL